MFAQTMGNKKIEEEEREVKAEWINMKKNSTGGKKRRTLWYFHFFFVYCKELGCETVHKNTFCSAYGAEEKQIALLVKWSCVIRDINVAR